jgi:CHAT domain-containing protein
VVQSRDETRLGKGLLALGDPAGAGQPGSLPEARQEVTAIAKLYPAAEVLVGERATKTVLLAPEATQRRALHLAAHGVLDSIQPDRSFIQLAPSGTDDGKLRVGEIYGLNLNAVDLVTLSACRTALGEGNPDGAEITSLAESFSSAGTPTVIASLWSVEDQSTRQLMETFYKEWAAGKPKSACLRTAQLALLQNPATRHPFYWAPFEVLGDWR